MIEPPGRRIRDMMRPEAQARGRRLRSSRGRGLGLKAASYPEPEARGFNQNIIIEEDPLLTPLDHFCMVIMRFTTSVIMGAIMNSRLMMSLDNTEFHDADNTEFQNSMMRSRLLIFEALKFRNCKESNTHFM